MDLKHDWHREQQQRCGLPTHFSWFLVPCVACRKGQATNDVLFGGVSLGKEGVKTLEEMRKTAEKGIKIE